MSGKKSKQKGARAEREVCKILMDWWTSDFDPADDEVKFTRSPLSGGWSSKKEFDAVGDVICSDPTFPFTVEAKHRERWSEDRFFEGKRSPAWKWIAQVEKESEIAVKFPLLFFRKNGMEWMVAIPTLIFANRTAPMFRITLPEKFWYQSWDILTAEEFCKVPAGEWL